MAEVDGELIEKVVRWCAEAGRQAVAAEIRGALAPLSWDELLAVRALLADPPPARPLGPQALADIARGAPADVAAERERAGRYRREDAAGDPAPAPAAPSSPAQRSSGRPRGRGKQAKPIVVIRRARDRAPAEIAAPPELPHVDELRRPEGRSELERLLRRHGARRGAILAALAARFRGGDGGAPGEAELESLLDHHGLSRAFERREKDELLHALRAAGGVRAAAAARVGLDASGFDSAVVRLGAAADAERIRDERRAELRGRATLSDRARLLLEDEPRLRDLGLLDEVDRDLRGRLPEHVRALRSTGEPLRSALAASLSIAPPAVEALATRFALELGPRSQGGPRGARAASPGARPRIGGRPRTADGPRAGGGSRAGGRGGSGPTRSGGGGRPGGRDRAAAGPRGDRREGRRPASPSTPGERRPVPPSDARPGGRPPAEKRAGPPRGVSRPPADAASPRPRGGPPRPTGGRPAGPRAGGPRTGRGKPTRGPPRR